jgi:hypothetical protein
MAYKLQLKRGLTSALPTGSAGEPLFTTDTNDLYIGTGAANQRYQKYIASGTSSQFLKGDGSLDSTNYTPTSRTLTINGTAYDLSGNRTWNVGTVTTAAATTGGQVSFFNGATVITSVSGLYFDGVDKLGIATTSPAYNLDVTGTARMTGNLTAASIIKSGGTSSQYLMADGSTSTLTNPVTGTGTTNYLPKWTSGSALGNSLVVDNGSNLTYTGEEFIVNKTGGAFITLLSGDSDTQYIQFKDTGGALGSIRYAHSTNGMTFKSNGSDMMTLTSTGLGIGTTSPSRKLTVTSTDIGIRMDNSSNTNAGLEYYVSTGSFYNWLLGAQYNVGNTFEITPSTTLGGTTYSTPAFVVNASGNVGIGTTSPSYLLDVAGTSRSDLHIFRSNQSAPTADAFIFRPADNSIALGTANSERMRINASGNMGLGVVPSAWYSTGFKSFQMNGGGYAVMSGNGEAYHANNAYFDTTIDWKYYANGTATRYDQRAGQHIWFTAPSGTAGNAISFTQAMTLDASGRLGVGTTSPATILHLVQSAGPTLRLVRTSNRFDISADNDFMEINARDASTYMIFKTADTERLRITSGGLVGIGNTNPGSYNAGVNNLVVGNLSGYTGITISSGSAQEGNINFADGLTGGELYRGVITYNHASDSMYFYTLSNERLRITSGGELLINTTSDAGDYKLQVNGNIYISGRGNYPNIGNVLNLDTYTSNQDKGITNFYQAQNFPTSNSYTRIFDIVSNGDATGGGAIRFLTSAGNSAPASSMYISPSGSVGINTTSPAYKLDVNGGIYGKGLTADSDGGVGNALYAYNQVLSGSSTNALIQLATTWNTTGNADAIVLDVTNTASGASSRLLDLKVGGSSIFKVQRNGRINASSLPTSSVGLSSGDIWNDGGTLKIV